MYGDLGRAGRGAAWVVLALCGLSACNTAPEGGSAATSAAADRARVVEEVRLATDRSGALQDVVTLPNGEQMRRVSLSSGFSHVLVAKPGPDGKPTVSCVDSAPAAEAFLADDKQGAAQ